jgi:hypothetical protein
MLRCPEYSYARPRLLSSFLFHFPLIMIHPPDILLTYFRVPAVPSSPSPQASVPSITAKEMIDQCRDPRMKEMVSVHVVN